MQHQTKNEIRDVKKERIIKFIEDVEKTEQTKQCVQPVALCGALTDCSRYYYYYYYY